MSFEFPCPKCKRVVEADEDWIGVEAECPFCGATITVSKTSAKPVRNPVEYDDLEESRRCPHCGAMLDDDDDVCNECGRKLA